MRRIASAIVLAVSVGLMPTNAVLAASWAVDDTCALSYSGTYFVITGPSSGWHIHQDAASPGDCHLYTQTSSNANPVQTAAYYLPVTGFPDGYYRVWAFINCEHKNAWMKYWVYLHGSGGGVSLTATKVVTSYCDMSAQVVSASNFRASEGAYVRLVDNTGTATTYQNADWLLYLP